MQSLERGASPTLNVRVPKALLDKIDSRSGTGRGARAEFVREALRLATGEICCLSTYWGSPQECRHDMCGACGSWSTEAPDGSFSCGHTLAEIFGKNVGN